MSSVGVTIFFCLFFALLVSVVHLLCVVVFKVTLKLVSGVACYKSFNVYIIVWTFIRVTDFWNWESIFVVLKMYGSWQLQSDWYWYLEFSVMKLLLSNIFEYEHCFWCVYSFNFLLWRSSSFTKSSAEKCAVIFSSKNIKSAAVSLSGVVC